MVVNDAVDGVGTAVITPNDKCPYYTTDAWEVNWTLTNQRISINNFFDGAPTGYNLSMNYHDLAILGNNNQNGHYYWNNGIPANWLTEIKQQIANVNFDGTPINFNQLQFADPIYDSNNNSYTTHVTPVQGSTFYANTSSLDLIIYDDVWLPISSETDWDNMQSQSKYYLVNNITPTNSKTDLFNLDGRHKTIQWNSGNSIIEKISSLKNTNFIWNDNNTSTLSKVLLRGVSRAENISATGSVSGTTAQNWSVTGLFAPINETQVIKNCISTVSFDVNGFQSVNENYFGAFLTVFTTNANYVDNNYENILILSPSNYGGSNTRKGSISSYCLKGGSYQKIVNFIGVKFVQEITNMPAFYDDSSNSGTKDYTNLTIANAKKQTSYTGWDFTEIWAIDENNSYPYLLNPWK